MFTLYVVCLLIGGALVVLSIFGGGDVDVDADVAADPDLDVEASGEGLAAAARFLGLRNAVFFAAFFGLAGTLLTSLGTTSALTAGFAVGAGTVAAVSIGRVFGWLRSTESGALPDAGTFAGAQADVILEIGKGRMGKVAVRRGDRIHQFVARPHRDAGKTRFRTGDEVVIVRVDNEVAEIAGNDFLG